MISQNIFNLGNKSVWNGQSGTCFPKGLETLAEKLAEAIEAGDVCGEKSPDGANMAGQYMASDGSWTLNVYAASKNSFTRTFTLFNPEAFVTQMGFDLADIKGIKVRS